LFGAATNSPPLFAGGMSSKFQCDGVVYINASSSRHWVLDVGAPKPKSRVNWGVGSCENQGCNGALGVTEPFRCNGAHLPVATMTNREGDKDKRQERREVD
jgi:hypothetical protein